MTKRDKFLGQPMNDPFGSAVKLGRHSLGQRRNLSDTHSRASTFADSPSPKFSLAKSQNEGELRGLTSKSFFQCGGTFCRACARVCLCWFVRSHAAVRPGTERPYLRHRSVDYPGGALFMTIGDARE